MVKDERLSKEYIQDIYWDVDLKKAEEDFKNNGYKFPAEKAENDDLEKLPPKKSSPPPTPNIESPKKATATKNKPGPKSKTKVDNTSEEGQEDSAKKSKPGPKSKKDAKSKEIRYVN